MSDLNNPPQGDPLDPSATGSVADLINTIEDDGNPPSGDPPAPNTDDANPPSGDPPAPNTDDDDDLDDERVNRYLERKGAVALPAETVASILSGTVKAAEPAPVMTDAERLAAEKAASDEADELEYLRIADPAAYQRKMSDITVRAVQEHTAMVDEMVDEVIKSVPEMREPDEIATVRNKLRSMSLDQLKEARSANRHISAAQSFAYTKLKNMKEAPKKTTAPAPKASDRPNRTEQKPEPQGTSAAKAGLESALSRRLRKEVVIKQ